MKIRRRNIKIPVDEDSQSFVISDFDDLVFKNRNREYGAYQLRKRYNKVLFSGIVVATFIASSAVLIPFLATPRSERIIMGGGRFVQVRMENLQPPPEEIYVPPVPPPPKGTKKTETVEYIPPVVVDSVFIDDKPQITNDAALSSQDNEVVDASGAGFGDDLIPGGDGSGSEEPLFIVEVMPTFKGGNESKFAEWVSKRTNYPQAAIDNKIRGTVYLTFIVEKDGSVSNVTVIRGVHPLLDKEAIKAISESPKWSPGLQRGQPVRVRFQIPLSFMY